MIKNYTICICDDEQDIRSQLKQCILQYSFSKEIDIKVIEFTSADQLLQFSDSYDILFLDIRFGDKNIGIDIAEKLRLSGNNSIIVILSALRSMSLEGYRAEPFRFIVKPFSKEDIVNVLNGCINKLNRSVPYLQVTSDFQTEIIRTDRILYIYSQNRKRQIICIGQAAISTWQSLNELMSGLPGGKFAFSHKSYIVNLDLVDSVRHETITLTDKTVLPLGSHFKDSFMKALLLNADK